MYTTEEVVVGRRCGLKRFDKALQKRTIQELIDEAIDLSRRLESWGPSNSWANFDWSFHNTWKKYGGGQTATFNVDECLTPEQMQHVAKSLGIEDEYLPTWPRKDKPCKMILSWTKPNGVWQKKIVPRGQF